MSVILIKKGTLIMIYAKSMPEESLAEHTERLVNNYKVLKKYYGNKIEDENMWNILLIAVRYHDTGKVYSYFQNKIRKEIRKKSNIDLINVPVNYDVPHNYLSPMFIPYKQLGIEKQYEKVLIQAVGYHHERDKEICRDKIKEIINRDLKGKVQELQKELDIDISNKIGIKYIGKLRNRIHSKDDNYKLYVLVKGLLHRIDHSASAHQEIERDIDKNVAEYTLNYLKRYYELREVQKFTQENKEENIILIASTGIGKTESALLWINNDKAFFTLPLRVSINALFERVSNEEDIGYGYAGLLHSTSIDYLDEYGYEKCEDIYEQSKILSRKLTFSTIDQIFKFPFKYRGYEKMLATYAYSKIIIDEIQAYSPEIAAVLLKGLEMIHEMGGKFMIMTATLPRLYIQYLEKRQIINYKDIKRKKFLSEVIRHKINVKEKSIKEDIKEIIKRGKDKKVIVIVNTVDRAIELFDIITEINNGVNTYLLHSLFIQKHRSELEKNIKTFADNENTVGIWITTQIVEASLDVDFDYLFTELSTLDSLFQRLGRCYRKRPYSLSEPNVYIYTEDVKGIGTIYDKDIWNDSRKMILDYDMKELKEDDKVNMVDKLYSKENLDGTDFLNKFNTALRILDTKNEYDISSNEAQRMLRNINNINVIPREIFDNIYNLIENYKSETDKKKRKQLRREINKYTVSIPIYKAKAKGCTTESNIQGLENILILERVYEYEDNPRRRKGVIVDELLSNIW